MIDALLVRAVNSFEKIGVFAVLLSTRGCCNQERPMCLPARVVWLYGFDDRKCQMSKSVVRAASNTTRGPFAQPPSCNWA